MRVMVLQCFPINPPFKIPTDPPHPPSGSMISRSLFIPLSLFPQIVKSILLSWQKHICLCEAAVDQEDKIVVPPRKDPEVEKKKNRSMNMSQSLEKKKRVRRGRRKR
ncbi:hypothetical protein Bca4012_047795 [Brassica carinata]